MSGRLPRTPNTALALLLNGHGMSHKGLAFRVNQLAERDGQATAYSHSSVARWLAGATPKDPVPQYIAAALTERIGRTVMVEEIGMAAVFDQAPRGWDFPRDREGAIKGARTHWSAPEAPHGAFAAPGYVLPVTRWLAVPTDSTDSADSPGQEDRSTGRLIEAEDLKELQDTAEQARLWDARFGGGNWRVSSIRRCLNERALPLLSGRHHEAITRELFSITAELSRVAAWAAFDAGHSAAAQQHFVQALRLARAGGDIEMGAYVLTTMALHTILEGAPDQALDMAQGAYHRGRHHASRRVLAFAKLAEARALARMGDATGASTALSRAETWLDKITPGSQDSPRLSYVTHGRLAADATEIFRDLRKSRAALGWSQQAGELTDVHQSRAVGLRMAVAATAACQARDLDAALDHGDRALSLLQRVESTRAQAHLDDVAVALAPWAAEPQVGAFLQRLKQAELTTAAGAR
ncbi:sporulation associated protein [Streptomyces sp. AP-93]|uniref:sporulation associated protein n=1 Tax=Streptomyces sp. AP-93 TaxID=2929048 RepID=UPI001FB03D65|nr:sporulation associated protein [Streptomyces sp. AP-93]MCJ0872543.1 sporulation associated protein [Streptomyces sp. AP-93]